MLKQLMKRIFMLPAIVLRGIPACMAQSGGVTCVTPLYNIFSWQHSTTSLQEISYSSLQEISYSSLQEISYSSLRGTKQSECYTNKLFTNTGELNIIYKTSLQKISSLNYNQSDCFTAFAMTSASLRFYTHGQTLQKRQTDSTLIAHTSNTSHQNLSSIKHLL